MTPAERLLAMAVENDAAAVTWSRKARHVEGAAAQVRDLPSLVTHRLQSRDHADAAAAEYRARAQACRDGASALELRS